MFLLRDAFEYDGFKRCDTPHHSYADEDVPALSDNALRLPWRQRHAERQQPLLMKGLVNRHADKSSFSSKTILKQSEGEGKRELRVVEGDGEEES